MNFKSGRLSLGKDWYLGTLAAKSVKDKSEYVGIWLYKQTDSQIKAMAAFKSESDAMEFADFFQGK